jgi:hypothetical protein
METERRTAPLALSPASPIKLFFEYPVPSATDTAASAGPFLNPSKPHRNFMMQNLLIERLLIPFHATNELTRNVPRGYKTT